MSIDIKPGQVWAWNNSDDTFTISPDIELGDRASLVAVVDTSADRRTHLTPETIRECAHLVEDVDATPAPLDPSKVKAGDTVTVEVLTKDGAKADLTGEVRGTGYNLWVGPISITMPADDIERITLTDHQPAPEPEPVWKPGTVAVATVEGMPGVLVTRPPIGSHYGDEEQPWAILKHPELYLRSIWRSDLDLADIRPLVVLDPAAAREKIAEGVRAKLGGPLGAWYDVSDVVLAALGIEAS